MRKKWDKIDFIMVFAIIFFLMVGTLSVLNAQNKIVGKGFTIESDEQFTTIVFEDGSKDKLYQNSENGGIELYYVPMGELVLNTKEYQQFIKDVKKASKRSEVEITRDKYTVNSYTWSDDSIYFLNNKTFAVGEIFLDDIKKIN
tara:strand:+ start:123 stop:554 length:432 start_codon:yes stop_codon:yes gene_type:complete